MNLLSLFNAIEAGWWLLCAGFIAGRGHRIHGLTLRLRVLLSFLLVAFAVTDVVEMTTGAWWRPRELMWANIVCVIGILTVGACVLQNRRSR
ncbi:MAG: hypothetical protein KDA93_09030 [Planctomycetaceae bacterium]|nr:hypothetical protein [Planctomycetaceae bacterium]